MSDDLRPAMIVVRDLSSGAEQWLPRDVGCVGRPRRASGDESEYAVRVLDERSARVQFADHRGDACFSDANLQALSQFRIGDVLLVDGGSAVGDPRLARLGYRAWISVVVVGEAADTEPARADETRSPALA